MAWGGEYLGEWLEEKGSGREFLGAVPWDAGGEGDHELTMVRVSRHNERGGRDNLATYNM